MMQFASRTVICVTPLRLDAANRHHRFAADVDGVAAQGKPEHRRFGKGPMMGKVLRIAC